MAIKWAAQVHSGQFDKNGVAYILHPLAVMNMVAPDRDAMIVAVLHDAIEDFRGSGYDKRAFLHDLELQFEPHIFKALLTITHKPKDEETYDEYIERVASNFLARKVKIKDLTHNMDPRRIPAGKIVDKDFARWDKYRRALIRLERED